MATAGAANPSFPTAEERGQQLVSWIATAALLALAPMLVDGVRVLHQGVQLARMPHPTCATESYVLEGIRRVAAGETLYPTIDGLPLVVQVYNPLSYATGGWIARALELEGADLWLAGRVVPLISAVGILALLGGFVWRRGNDWRGAVLVMALVLYFHSSTLTDFFRNRPETPALLLTLAAWILAQQRPKGWTLTAALCAVAAIGFKQTMLAAPAAIVLQLLFEKNFRQLLQYVGACVLAGLALVLGSIGIFGEGYLQHTVIAMGSDPIHPLRASAKFYPLLIDKHWGALPMIAGIGVFWLLHRRSYRPLLMYLGICLIWTSFAHGKVGADVNYHGELSLLLVLTVAVAVMDMVRYPTRLVAVPLGLLVLATWVPIAVHGFGWNHVCTNRAHPVPHGFSLEPPFGDRQVLADRYAVEAGDALIFDSQLAVAAGRPLVLDWLTLQLLFSAGRFDFDWLVEPIRGERFRVIVFDRSINDPWMRTLYSEALAAGYKPSYMDGEVIELSRSPLLGLAD